MKKQRTFEQRWNATALRRILKQLKQSDVCYLCNASPEFKELWGKHSYSINCLANACDAVKQFTVFPTGYSLFYPPLDMSYSHWTSIARQVRIDFLTHEIKRLTKKK